MFWDSELPGFGVLAASSIGADIREQEEQTGTGYQEQFDEDGSRGSDERHH